MKSRLLRLPKELRDEIYDYSIPKGEWRIINAPDLSGLSLAKGIGDPTGFYFPFRNDLGVLRINKQIRDEALSLAYRKTVFCLDDMDDFIKVAISVGKIGRENIESLEFAWASRSDESTWSGLDPEDPCPRLPALHTARCVQFLKHCRRLNFLRLYFDNNLISEISPKNFALDPGIRELASLRGINTVEILNELQEPLCKYESIARLKEKMELPED